MCRLFDINLLRFKIKSDIIISLSLNLDTVQIDSNLDGFIASQSYIQMVFSEYTEVLFEKVYFIITLTYLIS